MRIEPFGGSAALRLGTVLTAAALIVSACQTATSETSAPGDPTEPPVEAAVTAAAETEAAPDKTMCQSGEDLAVDIAFLRSLDVSEDGVVSLIVGVDAALGEAQVLVDLAADEYRPLVEDTIVTLQELRDIGAELEEEQTLGASIATVGEAITEVGEAMDTLETELREPCPQQVS